MPFDVAFSLPPDEAAAWQIIFCEMDGEEFDVSLMQWKSRN